MKTKKDNLYLTKRVNRSGGTRWIISGNIAGEPAYVGTFKNKEAAVLEHQFALTELGLPLTPTDTPRTRIAALKRRIAER